MSNDDVVYRTPHPIEVDNHYTTGRKVETVIHKLDKIISSLGRIEDMLYYYTHGLKQPE